MAGAVDLPNSAGEIPGDELIQLITGGHLVFASIHHGFPSAGQRPMIRVELTTTVAPGKEGTQPSYLRSSLMIDTPTALPDRLSCVEVEELNAGNGRWVLRSAEGGSSRDHPRVVSRDPSCSDGKHWYPS